MTSTLDLRDPSVIREELNDLVQYLSGIPDEVRQNGAFASYEQRAAELSRELILSDVSQFAQSLPLPARSGFGQGGFRAMHDTLSHLAWHYRRTSEWFLLASYILNWSLITASAGSMVSAVSVTSLVLPLTAVTTSLAAVSLFRFADQARNRQRIADQLAALKEEMAYTFGPGGEVLRPSEYYPASSKRFEQLLEEIKTQVSNQRGRAAGQA